MASNFASILDRPTNTIERPKSMPPGTYLCVVKGQPREDASSQKKTPFIEFDLTPTQAMDDVDQELLAEALTDKNTGEKRPLNSMSIKATYYLTEAAAWRLTEFFEHLGFDVESGKFNSRQMIAESPNQQVYATLRHEATQDGKGTVARLAGTARVD